MEYLKLIHELIHELSYRVGVPDLKKKEHQAIISEILTEWGKVEEKYRIMSFLTEAPASDAQGEDSAYTHIGRGIYVRRGDEGKPSAQKYKQSASGQLQPISQDEYDQMKGDQGAEGEEAAADANAQTAAQAGGGQPEKPETGQSLSAPEYQDQINKEKEVQNQIEKEKASKTTPVKKTPEEFPQEFIYL